MFQYEATHVPRYDLWEIGPVYLNELMHVQFGRLTTLASDMQSHFETEVRLEQTDKMPNKKKEIELGPHKTPGAIDINPGSSRLLDRKESKDNNLSQVPPEREEHLPGKAEEEHKPREERFPGRDEKLGLLKHGT